MQIYRTQDRQVQGQLHYLTFKLQWWQNWNITLHLRNTGLSQILHRSESQIHLSTRLCLMFWEPDTESITPFDIWAVWCFKRKQTWACFETIPDHEHMIQIFRCNRSSVGLATNSMHVKLQSDLHTDLLVDLQEQIYKKSTSRSTGSTALVSPDQSTHSSFRKSSSHLIYPFTRKHNGSSCWNW